MPTFLDALLSRDTLPNTLPALALRHSQREGTTVLIHLMEAQLSQNPSLALHHSQREGTTVLIQFIRDSTEPKKPHLHFAILREKALQCLYTLWRLN